MQQGCPDYKSRHIIKETCCSLAFSVGYKLHNTGIHHLYKNTQRGFGNRIGRIEQFQCWQVRFKMQGYAKLCLIIQITQWEIWLPQKTFFIKSSFWNNFVVPQGWHFVNWLGCNSLINNWLKATDSSRADGQSREIGRGWQWRLANLNLTRKTRHAQKQKNNYLKCLWLYYLQKICYTIVSPVNPYRHKAVQRHTHTHTQIPWQYHDPHHSAGQWNSRHVESMDRESSHMGVSTTYSGKVWLSLFRIDHITKFMTWYQPWSRHDDA